MVASMCHIWYALNFIVNAFLLFLPLVVKRADPADSFSAWNKVLACVFLSNALLQVPSATYNFDVRRKQHAWKNSMSVSYFALNCGKKLQQLLTILEVAFGEQTLGRIDWLGHYVRIADHLTVKKLPSVHH